MSAPEDEEEATLQAYRRLLARAAATVAEATAAQDRDAEAPVDPPPCP